MSEKYLFTVAVGNKMMLIDAINLKIVTPTSDLMEKAIIIRKKSDNSLAKKSIRIHRDSKLNLLASVNFGKDGITRYCIIKGDKTDLPKVKTDANGGLDAELLEVDILDILENMDSNIEVFTTELAKEVLDVVRPKVEAVVETELNNDEIIKQAFKESIEQSEYKEEPKAEEPKAEETKAEETSNENTDISALVNKLMELTIENNKLREENKKLVDELETAHNTIRNTIEMYSGLEETEILDVEEVYSYETVYKSSRIDKYFAETLLKTMKKFDRHTFEYEDYMYFNEIKCFPAYYASRDGKSYEQIVQLKVPGNTVESLLALVTVDDKNPVSVVALDSFRKYKVTNELLRKLDLSYRKYRAASVNEAVRTFV